MSYTDIKNRIPQSPGRRLIEPENDNIPFYAKISRADNPIEDGTAIDRALLQDIGIMNADAVKTDNTINITATSGAKRIMFIAPSDFLSSDIYILNGSELALQDLRQRPLQSAWLKNSPVELMIIGNNGFFRGAGGGAALNIFNQLEQPTVGNGLWVKHDDVVEKTLITRLGDIAAEGEWTTKTAMPTARSHLTSSAVGTVIYAIGGSGGASIFSITQAYDTVTNLWTTKAVMPTPRYGLTSSAVGTVIYAIGGYGTTGVIAYNQAYVLYGDHYPKGTLLVNQGTQFDNKAKLIADENLELDMNIEKCYYHDGEALRIVSSATNYDDTGWTNII